MTQRWLAIVWSVLLVSQPIATASAPPQIDPISGTWTGEVITDSEKRFAVTLALKFDGKRAVSGTVAGLPAPADVKEGTFDSKTSALTLRLGRVGDPKVAFTLDGTVVKDTASGRAIDNSGEGTFQIARKR